jgi:predicted RecA/RadA family phage recombinase
MAPAAADRLTPMKEGLEKAYPVKTNTKIYAGTMVAVDGNGLALPAADAANLKVVGIADVTADNSAGADGAILVKVRRGLFRLPATSITQAMVGKVMYVVDDQTFDDAKGTNGIKAGRLMEYIGAAEGWIEIRGSGLGAVSADAVVTAVADGDATYGQPEADLLNDIKAKYNAAVALLNELKLIVNTYLA